MLEPGCPPKSIIESVEIGWLPSPPQVFNQLVDVCCDPCSSIGDLAYLISIDPVLTSKLIMSVNTVAFEISGSVNNLQQAIALVGQDQVKKMVLTSSIQQLFAGLVNSRKKSVCDIWVESLYCAVFGHAIAETINFQPGRDAYLAGLLHHYGKIVLDTKFHDIHVEIQHQDSDNEITRSEIQRFGITHADLGADLIANWSSVNPSVADAIRFHHLPGEQLNGCDLLCQVVAEASTIARQWSRHGCEDEYWHSELVDDEQLKEIYSRSQAEVCQLAARLGVSLADGVLTQDHFFRDIEKESIKLGRKIRDATLLHVMQSGEIHPENDHSPRNLLLTINRELQLIFSISDVLMLFPDSASKELLTLYEVNRIQPGSQFSIDNKESAIIRSFQENRYLWIEPEYAYMERTPASDRQILGRLNHEIALSIPMASNDQVIGLVVIGLNKIQKAYLANQLNFISGYLQNIAQDWLNYSELLIHQTLQTDVEKEQEKREIEKLIHEISNPLSVIGNYIDIIKGNSPSDEAGTVNRKEIEILKEELERIRNIVLNFKDAEIPGFETVSLNDELEICIPLYIKSFNSAAEVQIIWELDRSDCKVKISRNALRQIVLNLIKNAIEAQGENKVITVSSRQIVNINGTVYAQFSISDRGEGVDAETQHRLFSSLSSKKEGSSRGLGLSTAVEIIERYGGQIKYMANEYGGASFEVSIPVQLN